jgi:hypothetical protein
MKDKGFGTERLQELIEFQQSLDLFFREAYFDVLYSFPETRTSQRFGRI